MTETIREGELIETLAAGIAHEVRNPLNSLQINLRILQDELADLIPDRGAHPFALLGKIAAELKRLDDFVSEFLRFARPPRLKLEHVPVRALLSELAAFLAPECASKGVELRLDLQQGSPTVFVDGLQLKQAILNLLLNALQATPPGGRIVLRTGGDARFSNISVVDNGEGIDPQAKEKIFTVFFSTREGGTGLGLPIARRIVEEHGGSIQVVSTRDQGTTATIALPVRHGS
jgi:two-component system, NtrC family, sensor histidine kinase HydH